MDAVKEFLADEVLGEKKTITYRYLSRALKINVNAAKRALYNFHTTQNAKRAGSLHATYLLYGTKQAADDHSNVQNCSSDEADDEMADISQEEQQSETVSTTVMTLVAEENLECALSQYTTLNAIHVYSVSSQPMSDLDLLADSVRQLHELRGANAQEEDPKTFGTISNSHAQRRQRKGPGPNAGGTASASASAAKPTLSDTPGPNSIWNKVNKASAKVEDKSATSSSKPTTMTEPTKPSSSITSSATSSAANAPPLLKRSGSSGGRNIMQAFAKGASAGKPKKIEPTPPAKKAEEGDIDMDMSDDGGDDGGDEDVLPKAQEVAGGKSRQQRQEELRKMMEEDDDEDDAEDDRNKEDEREDSPMEDVVEEKPPKNDGPSEVITASSGDGRRRGKRRIMRKKMIEDKDGYLVTIQEEGWESFSEDEAPSSKVSAVATPASSAPSSAPKQKLSASKKGQGNIMSFFAKK